METIQETIQHLNSGQWSATTGATSAARYRNCEGVDIDALCGHIAVRIHERTGGPVMNINEIIAVAKWMKYSKRAGLILMGNTGTGKSTMAYALADAIGVKNASPYTYPMQKLEKIAKESGDWFEEIMRERRYLVLDDVGTESRDLNDYGNHRTIFNEIIATRYDLKLPVIITTNLNSDMIRNQYGEKTSSRLAEMCDTLLMVGDDLRLK